jgi:nitrogen fixation/metabolism regulation signal transduction histidine kinase
MTHTEQVAHLRTLATLDPDTTTLQQAMINVLEKLAEAVDRLEAEHPPPPTERGFGTI